MSNKKEEITDLFSPSVYEEIDSEGKHIFYVGRLLKFNYEGSLTSIKITKIDRKNKRMWGQHVEIIDQKIVRSHYGHSVNVAVDPPYCTDCEALVTQPSTEDGEKKYKDRLDSHLADGTPINE